MERRITVGLRLVLGITLMLAITPAASGQDEQPGRIIPLATKIELKEAATSSQALIVAADVPQILLAIDGEIAELAEGQCPPGGKGAFSSSIPIIPTATTEASRLEFCVRGVKSGSGRVVILGTEGSSASVPVIVSPKVPAATGLEPPESIPIVTTHDTGLLEIDPGFAVSNVMSAVAVASSDAGVVSISNETVLDRDRACSLALAGIQTTTTVKSSATSATTTTVASTVTTKAPSTNVLACGLNKVGTYTASFDTNGSEDGGDLTVTAVRRRTRWLAVGAAVLGGGLAGLGVWLTKLASKREKATKAAQEEKSANDLIDEAGKDFLKIQETLRPGGTEIEQLSAWWAPLRWPTLFRGSTTTSPTIAEAGALYTEAGECVKPLLDLWLHYERGHGPVPDVAPEDIPIARAARADLEWGIALHERGDTPARVVARLERHAALAQKALETDLELAHLDDRDPDLARRKRLANATLEEVDDVLALVPPDPMADVLASLTQPGAAVSLFNATSGQIVKALRRLRAEDLAGAGARAQYDQRMLEPSRSEDPAVVVVAPPVPKPSRSWDPTLVLAAPTGPPPRSPARAALDSGWAQGLAIGLGGLAAVLVGMQDALDPNAAWGTLGDFMKVVAAVAAFPSLTELARKLLAGSPIST